MDDKASKTAKKPKYDGYQHWLASLVYKCFDKKTPAMRTNKFAGGTVTNEIMPNKEFSEELYKQIIKKFKKQKVLFPGLPDKGIRIFLFIICSWHYQYICMGYSFER